MRRWTIEDPFLYEVNVELQNTSNEVVDSYQSYFGFRTVSLDGKKFKLNGKTIFQRLVLDQGYYPDGLMTAPRDEDLVEDIRLSLEAGSMGRDFTRKCSKNVLYHADRMGYLVWGEFGDWGAATWDAFLTIKAFLLPTSQSGLKLLSGLFTSKYCWLVSSTKLGNPSWRRCPNSMTSQEACS